MTQLQEFLCALFDTLDDARAELDGPAYAAFVSIACDRVGRDAARGLFAELYRRERNGDDEAAA